MWCQNTDSGTFRVQENADDSVAQCLTRTRWCCCAVVTSHIGTFIPLWVGGKTLIFYLTFLFNFLVDFGPMLIIFFLFQVPTYHISDIFWISTATSDLIITYFCSFIIITPLVFWIAVVTIIVLLSFILAVLFEAISCCLFWFCLAGNKLTSDYLWFFLYVN